MTEIKITLFDYHGVKIIKSLPDSVILHDNYLEYKWFVTIEKKEDTIPIEKKYQGRKITLKKHISSITAHYSNDHECYQCTVYCSGEDRSEVSFLFQSLKEAIEIQEKILIWIIK